MTVSIKNMTATWSDPANTSYTAIGMNVNAPFGANANSKILNLEVNSSSVFSVNGDGSFQANTQYGGIGSYIMHSGLPIENFLEMFADKNAYGGATFSGSGIGQSGTWRMMGYTTYNIVNGDINETHVLFLTVRIS